VTAVRAAEQRCPVVPPQGQLARRWLFFVEKWYFDGQTADGTFFFVYLAPTVLFGKRSAELVACLFPPEGGEHRVSLHLRGREIAITEDRTHAVFPGGELLLSADACRFTLAVDQAEIDLRYRPMDPPWAPLGDGVVLRRRKRRLRWVVPVPRARLQGTVRVGEGQRELDGYGYSDFVQTDIAPWRLPLRELLWGRALGEDLVVVWNQVGFRPGSQRAEALGDTVGLGLVRQGLGDTQTFERVNRELRSLVQHETTQDRYPTELELRFGLSGLRLGIDRTRLLLGDFVADVQGFKSRFERWLYRKATGNPVEYKLLSRLRAGPHEAIAAHEWVRWGRRRTPTEEGSD